MNTIIVTSAQAADRAGWIEQWGDTVWTCHFAVEPQPEPRGTAGTYWHGRVYSGTEWPHAVAAILAEWWTETNRNSCYACFGHGKNTDSLGQETICQYCNGSRQPVPGPVMLRRDDPDYDPGSTRSELERVRNSLDIGPATLVSVRVEQISRCVGTYSPEGYDPPRFVIVAVYEVMKP